MQEINKTELIRTLKFFEEHAQKNYNDTIKFKDNDIYKYFYKGQWKAFKSCCDRIEFLLLTTKG